MRDVLEGAEVDALRQLLLRSGVLPRALRKSLWSLSGSLDARVRTRVRARKAYSCCFCLTESDRRRYSMFLF